MQKLQPLSAHMSVKAHKNPDYEIFRKQIAEVIDEAQKFIATGYAKTYQWSAFDPAQDLFFKATIGRHEKAANAGLSRESLFGVYALGPAFLRRENLAE